MRDRVLREEKSMRKDQTVSEMAEEVLSRQARAMVAQTGQPFESALKTVSSSDAGQQLKGVGKR
jgi:hypothetical protein